MRWHKRWRDFVSVEVAKEVVRGFVLVPMGVHVQGILATIAAAVTAAAVVFLGWIAGLEPSADIALGIVLIILVPVVALDVLRRLRQGATIPSSIAGRRVVAVTWGPQPSPSASLRLMVRNDGEEFRDLEIHAKLFISSPNTPDGLWPGPIRPLKLAVVYPTAVASNSGTLPHQNLVEFARAGGQDLSFSFMPTATAMQQVSDTWRVELSCIKDKEEVWSGMLWFRRSHSHPNQRSPVLVGYSTDKMTVDP